MKFTSTSRAPLALALSIGVCLALTACSSGDGSAGAGAESAGSTSEAAAFYRDFTGAGEGKAQGEPITVGWVNLEGGDVSFPEVTESAEAAVALVNEELGGVGGRPIELRKCAIVTSEEQGQACAQEMLNDDEIDLVIEGVAPIGTGAFHQTMAGRKPVIVTNPTTVADTVAANSYGISAGAFTSETYSSYVTETVRAKTVGLLNRNDDPAAVAQGKRIRGLLETAGVKVNQSTYSGTTSDFTAPLTATGGNSNDALIVVAVSPPACIGVAKAVKQMAISKPVIGGFTCVSEAVRDGLGDFAPWTYIYTYENTALPEASPAVSAYRTTMEKHDKEQLGGLAPAGFAGVMTAVRTLVEAGSDRTPEKLSELLTATKSGAPMFSPVLAFGAFPEEGALGTKSARAYTYEGNGTWEDATDGKWINEVKSS
ncbi:ABC transporter substrate-binding protein [Streptomyces sp. NPDC002490]|uniref:ABC transporter substrate-binding protein n=1 Tax=Streptomyces sp. NPDC002490 TaxID=3154416 RepID=UPI0033310272